MESVEIEAESEDRSARLEDLREQCQSDFEREVLSAIAGRDLPLPDEAQKTIYDDGAPIAEVLRAQSRRLRRRIATLQGLRASG
jgi:hypothetical protein